MNVPVKMLVGLLCIGWASEVNAGQNWPQFRGPNASGIAEGNPLPVSWDVESGKNIKWKTKIPGLAHSSPIVWGDRVYVTTAISANPDPYLRVGLYGESPKYEEKVEHDFRVLCLDKNTGEVLWNTLCYRGIPRSQRHIKATQANSSPTTNGKYIIAFFGSDKMYCLDKNGVIKWVKDFGVLDMGPPEPGFSDLEWGFASSPVIHGDELITLIAARNIAFLAKYDLKTGAGIWKMERPTYPGWYTPTVYADDEQGQVITNGYKQISGYDFETGAQLWWMHGGGDVPVPTPVVAHDLVFITNGHGAQSPVYAIKTSAKGDITLKDGERSNEYIAWSHPKIGNYMQTPLVYGDLLYICRDSGIMACHDARTGKKQYKKRLASGVGFTASPVAGDGKIYFTSEEGDVYVIKAGKGYELLGKNTLGEITMATPAISDGTIYWRTKDHIVAVQNEPAETKEPSSSEDKAGSPKPTGTGTN